jgi:hypothetical protein
MMENAGGEGARRSLFLSLRHLFNRKKKGGSPFKVQPALSSSMELTDKLPEKTARKGVIYNSNTSHSLLQLLCH